MKEGKIKPINGPITFKYDTSQNCEMKTYFVESQLTKITYFFPDLLK